MRHPATRQLVVVVRYGGGHRPCGTRREHEALSVDGARALEELPVGRARGQVECSGIYQDAASMDLGEKEGIFRESYVVAILFFFVRAIFSTS